MTEKRPPVTGIGLLIAALFVAVVIGVPICHPTEAAPRVDIAPVRPARVPLVYWLAECSVWPLSPAQLADDGIRVDWVRTHPERVSVHLSHRATRRRAMLAAHRLGSRETGWSVWSIRGPVSIKRLMVDAPACRVVSTYAAAAVWSAPAVDWLQARSTCYGSATWRGRVYTVWPCRWSTERAGQGTVTQVDGIGPGVLQGGSGRIAAGVTDE
jgi:hypothetical protein